MSYPDPQIAQRLIDDAPEGYLRLVHALGDVPIVLRGYKRNGEMATVTGRFCPSSGGGHSPRTLAALKQLLKAMQTDEPDSRERHGEGKP